MKKVLSMVLILAVLLSCASGVFAESKPVVLRFAWWGAMPAMQPHLRRLNFTKA